MAKTYTTTQGDAWDSIAFKLYGDEKQMTALIDANPVHRETVIFSAGIDLVVPTVKQLASSKLPPWKR